MGLQSALSAFEEGKFWWFPALGVRAVATGEDEANKQSVNDDDTWNYYSFRGSVITETNLEG